MELTTSLSAVTTFGENFVALISFYLTQKLICYKIIIKKIQIMLIKLDQLLRTNEKISLLLTFFTVIAHKHMHKTTF